MKTAPIQPAALGAPGFPDRLDAERAAAQSFVARAGLATRWAGRERFVILQIGFGAGDAFLACWKAWRDDAARSERLVFIALEAQPLAQADAARVHAQHPSDAASQLVAAWPPLTPNLHPLDFNGGRVRLLLGWGDVAALLPQVMASVDAFHGPAIAPGSGPEPSSAWPPERFKQLGRLAAPGAVLHLATDDAREPAGLATAGFVIDDRPPGPAPAAGRIAHHRPRHRPAALPGGLHVHRGERDALVIGAGLAGSAAAWGLGREGWRVTVLDRASDPAEATSGNAVGLFHGAVHAADGPHARLHRAAALRAARGLAPWIASGRVRGQIDGLLRLEDGEPDRRAAPFSVGHAEPLTMADARQRTGVPVPTGGWWFDQGGWLVPGDLVRALLGRSTTGREAAQPTDPDGGVRFVGHCHVARIERREARWHALDADGRSLADAAVLVLANALDAPRLLDASFVHQSATTALPDLGPLAAARGQITGVPVDALRGPLPKLPISGAGYAVPQHEGRLWCGATTQLDDPDPTLREADHQHNLAQLARLLGRPGRVDAPMASLAGRVGWRAVTPDRLPWVGALPDAAAFAQAARADRVRFVPRLRDEQGGLYVLGALGSRGITWSLLCGELLASWVTGAPCPVEADLRDALDPARALVAVRRAQASSGSSSHNGI